MRVKTRMHPAPAQGEDVRPAAFAALDLGTNNCRLLIARAADAGFDVIDSFSRIVRLGEGLGRQGRLSEAAMTRAIAALQICSGKIERHQVNGVRAVATEACRRAANGVSFVARAARETGIHIDIITPHEEAGLAVDGCAALLDASTPYALIVDIGGGSTEVMWLSVEASSAPKMLDCLSIPAGVNTLTDRHGPDPAPDTYCAVKLRVADALAELDAPFGIAAKVDAGEVQLVGTSGTVTTLAAAHLKLPRYMRNRIDGTRLSVPAALAVCRKFESIGHAGRRAHPCIGPARSAFVMAGCAIFEAICETWPVNSLTVADRGLREGMLMRQMGIRRRWPRQGPLHAVR